MLAQLHHGCTVRLPAFNVRKRSAPWCATRPLSHRPLWAGVWCPPPLPLCTLHTYRTTPHCPANDGSACDLSHHLMTLSVPAPAPRPLPSPKAPRAARASRFPFSCRPTTSSPPPPRTWMQRGTRSGCAREACRRGCTTATCRRCKPPPRHHDALAPAQTSSSPKGSASDG